MLQVTLKAQLIDVFIALLSPGEFKFLQLFLCPKECRHYNYVSRASDKLWVMGSCYEVKRLWKSGYDKNFENTGCCLIGEEDFKTTVKVSSAREIYFRRQIII